MWRALGNEDSQRSWVGLTAWSRARSSSRPRSARVFQIRGQTPMPAPTSENSFAASKISTLMSGCLAKQTAMGLAT